jgi:hypothetical protein
MRDLMVALLTWIGGNTGYNVDLDLPNIVFTARHNMCAQYGINRVSTCDASGLKAFYDKRETIYFGLKFDATDRDDMGRLLHELVHYVQWANGRPQDTCLGELELEAYDLQDRWRTQRGLQASTGEFKRIMLAASCDA